MSNNSKGGKGGGQSDNKSKKSAQIQNNQTQQKPQPKPQPQQQQQPHFSESDALRAGDLDAAVAASLEQFERDKARYASTTFSDPDAEFEMAIRASEKSYQDILSAKVLSYLKSLNASLGEVRKSVQTIDTTGNIIRTTPTHISLSEIPNTSGNAILRMPYTASLQLPLSASPPTLPTSSRNINTSRLLEPTLDWNSSSLYPTRTIGGRASFEKEKQQWCI